MRARRASLLAFGFCAWLLAPFNAHAQTWPARPVTVVVPFAAGVTGDIVARGLVEHLSSTLGQPFIVDNRAGAGANPGKITAGYPGNGTFGHITGELLQQRAGMTFVQTQYRGSPAIINDLLGEHIDIGMDSMAPYVALIQENKLRGLAIAGTQRWPLLPDVPTVAESGFPGFEAAVWYAFLAPTGTPPEILAKLNEASNAYLKTKAAADLYEKLGIQAAGGTPQELKAFIDAELEKWAPIIKAAKIEF